MEITSKNSQKKLIFKAVIWNIAFLLIFLCIFEAMGMYCFRHPEAVPKPFIRGLKHYYFSHGRNIVQVSPDCGRYDADLSYTLKPGQCTFANVEYTTEYSINSLGFRDDESSLDKPEIIVLGDSYAMGWGVQQNETIASLLEDKTGKKVLNLAVSSYGTAREIKALKKADFSNLKYLIIQYCDNDYYENLSFADNNGILPIMSRSDYDQAVSLQQKKTSYYPGKYAVKLVPAMLRYPLKNRFFKDEEDLVAADDEAKAFLNVLSQSGILGKDLTIIVFEMTEEAKNDGSFIESLNRLLRDEHSNRQAKIITFDASKIINKEDYFIMDSHIKPSGHVKIAEFLRKSMQ